jgi:hypothetical protein
MEDIRTYRLDNEQSNRPEDERRFELEQATIEEEVPFHIPRD